MPHTWNPLPGVDPLRRPDLTEAQEVANRIKERKSWIRSEERRAHPNPSKLARYRKQLADYEAMI